MTTVGNWAQIIRCRLAVASARRVDDPLTLAHRVRRLGDAYHHAGRTARAEQCFVEALAICRRHAHAPPLEVANATRSLAVLKHELGADDEARRLWRGAHDLYLVLDLPAAIAESAARLALLAHRQGDRQQSRECMAEARAAADRADDLETFQYLRDVTAQIEGGDGMPIHRV